MDEMVRIQCNFCHMAQGDGGQVRCVNDFCNAVIRPKDGRPVQFTVVTYTPWLSQKPVKAGTRPRA